jgi:hypothetical protein
VHREPQQPAAAVYAGPPLSKLHSVARAADRHEGRDDQKRAEPHCEHAHAGSRSRTAQMASPARSSRYGACSVSTANGVGSSLGVVIYTLGALSGVGHAPTLLRLRLIFVSERTGSALIPALVFLGTADGSGAALANAGGLRSVVAAYR